MERRRREQDARARRYVFRDLLRPLASTRRLRRCGESAVADGGVTVGVRANPDGTTHAGYGGVGTCGSVWSCPQCAAKIATRRAEEMADVMRAVDNVAGSAFLITLTMRHTLGDRLGLNREQRRELARLTDALRDWEYRAEMGDKIDKDARAADHAAHAALVAERGCWDAVSDAWAKVTSGGTWAKDVERHGGLLGWAKVVETTSGANGWHVHAHILACFADDVSVETVRPLVERMFRRWQRALERRGFDASGDAGADGKIPGWDVRRAQLGDGDLADYFVKMAHEITSGHRKESRRPGGRTPLMLARDAVETYSEAAVSRWWEWQAASEGRKQITWSGRDRDLRKLAALGVEQTDEEIAAEEHDADERIGLSAETWGWVRSSDNVTRVLDVAEDHGIPGLLQWLDEHGQTYVRGIGAGWAEQPPALPSRVIESWNGPPGLQLGVVPRDEGVGFGYGTAVAAVLREHTPSGRPLRRPSDRPPRWTDDARAVLARP